MTGHTCFHAGRCCRSQPPAHQALVTSSCHALGLACQGPRLPSPEPPTQSPTFLCYDDVVGRVEQVVPKLLPGAVRHDHRRAAGQEILEACWKKGGAMGRQARGWSEARAGARRGMRVGGASIACSCHAGRPKHSPSHLRLLWRRRWLRRRTGVRVAGEVEQGTMAAVVCQRHKQRPLLGAGPVDKLRQGGSSPPWQS